LRKRCAAKNDCRPLSNEISNARLAAYALPWFPVMAVNLAITGLVAGHYSSDLGIPLFAVSIVMLGSRLFDVVVDPWIGSMSDHSRSRFGRRKPWIAAGVPIIIGGAWMLFVPPPQVSAFYMFAAVAITYFGFTMIQIPYAAWGAELSSDYARRSVIAGWREASGVLGTLAAISAPLIATMLGHPGLGPALFGIAVGLAILLPLMMIPALAFVPEPPADVSETAPERAGFLENLRTVGENREFVWFSIAIFVTFVGISPGGAVGYLMMKHSFHAEGLYPYLAFGEYVSMMVCLPFWTWAATRIGKHRAIAIGIVWMLVFTLPIPYAGLADPHYVVVLGAIRGMGFGAIFVVPYAIAADVIDVDTLRSGQQRSGLFMAFGGMNLKLSFMVGVFLSTAWPTLFGFEPSAPTNTPAAEFQVAVSYAWITCFFLAIAAPMFWFFPLTRARHAELRAAIDARAVMEAAGGN
jgi:glycoside/pentoside/hexuronide:cation symporter, GPH family